MHDLILVGGGLANGLIAYRLRQMRPDLDIRLVEQGSTLGGNHIWSFFTTDLAPPQLRWMAPFIERRWQYYDVRFPHLERRIHSSYASFTSDRFHSVLMDVLGDAVLVDVAVDAVQADGVALADGRHLKAHAVIDGRGYRPSPALVLGYQKFTGELVDLCREHGLAGPLLIDARVPQQRNLRFFYVLPLGPRQLLIEDTRYSDDAVLDPDGDATAIRTYADCHGWRIERVRRREIGVLPVALAGDIARFWREAGHVPQSGMRAALFHATTGYSLPEAVRLADRLLDCPQISSGHLTQIIAEHSQSLWQRQRFYRLLNRMLFRAAEPAERYRVFQHFYRLPRQLIERFYAGRLTRYDQIRILAGKPPVPLRRALAVMGGSALTGG